MAQLAKNLAMKLNAAHVLLSEILFSGLGEVLLHFINFPILCLMAIECRCHSSCGLWVLWAVWMVWFLCFVWLKVMFLCGCTSSISDNWYQLGWHFCAFLLVTTTIAAGVKPLTSATTGKVILMHPPSSWCAVVLGSIEKHVTVKPTKTDVDGCNLGTNPYFTEQEETNWWVSCKLDLPLGISSPFPLPSSLRIYIGNRSKLSTGGGGTQKQKQ